MCSFETFKPKNAKIYPEKKNRRNFLKMSSIGVGVGTERESDTTRGTKTTDKETLASMRAILPQLASESYSFRASCGPAAEKLFLLVI